MYCERESESEEDKAKNAGHSWQTSSGVRKNT
jgi:hypothetical protein